MANNKPKYPTQHAALRAAIAACGTQSQLAEKLSAVTGKDVRQYNVADWLRRGMSWAWAEPVARVSGVDVDGLLPPPRKKKKSSA